MAQAAARERWARTSAVLALIANVNRDPKKTRPFKPLDFDPYAAPQAPAQGIEVNSETIEMLKSAFLERGREGT
jgi:hypothetical protein